MTHTILEGIGRLVSEAFQSDSEHPRVDVCYLRNLGKWQVRATRSRQRYNGDFDVVCGAVDDRLPDAILTCAKYAVQCCTGPSRRQLEALIKPELARRAASEAVKL